jgi:hypothetical protein
VKRLWRSRFLPTGYCIRLGLVGYWTRRGLLGRLGLAVKLANKGLHSVLDGLILGRLE